MTNKDVVVAESEEHASYGECINEQVGTANAPLPFGFTSIDDRVDDRQIAKHRQPVQKLLNESGMTEISSAWHPASRPQILSG